MPWQGPTGSGYRLRVQKHTNGRYSITGGYDKATDSHGHELGSDELKRLSKDQFPVKIEYISKSKYSWRTEYVDPKNMNDE